MYYISRLLKERKVCVFASKYTIQAMMQLLKNKLLNKFIFKDDINVNVYMAKIKFLPIQMHDGVKLLNVIEGEINVKISFNIYNLSAGDFLLINAFELHSIEDRSNTNKVLIVELDSELMENQLFVFDILFYRDFNTEIVNKVKYLMMLAYQNKAKRKELVKDIAEICDRYFPIQKYSIGNNMISPFSEHRLQDERMKKTYEYFYLHKNGAKRLNSLSDLMNIDKCYASRLIKIGTGESFQEMLNYFRVDRAELLLLGTDMPIQQISEHLNFSTVYYFNKTFSKFFKHTPSGYRKEFSSLVYPTATPQYELVELNDKNEFSDAKIIEFMEVMFDYFQSEGIENYKASNYEIKFNSDENLIAIRKYHK